MSRLGLPVRLCRAYRLGVVTMVLSSCSIGKGIADFGNDVANQPPVSFGTSRRVAVGHYSSPLVDPWDDRGPVIIAFEYKDDGPHLAMRPLDGTSGCDTGLAYASVVRDKLDNRAQVVAYQDAAGPQDCRGRVHFVDHTCKEYGSPVPNASLPDLLYSDPPGYLVNAAVCELNSDNKPAISSTQLLVIDPWSGASTVLAGKVIWSKIVSRDDLVVAVIDGGHYKIFNAQRQVTTDIGSAVTEIASLSGTDTGFALVDGGTLRTYKSVSDSAPVEIATDACQASSDSGGCLFYVSPCSDPKLSQLQCYRADTGKSTPIDSGTSAPMASHVTSGSADFSVIYTKQDAQTNSTGLWLYASGSAPSQVVGNFSRLYSWAPPPNLEIISLVDAGADQGQMVRHTPTADTVLVDSVSVNFSQGLLANFDASNSVGDLYTPPQLGQTPKLIIAGVPYVKDRNSIVTPPSTNLDSIPFGTAAIANAQGSIGDLTLLRYPTDTSPGPESPRKIASGVSPGGFKFFDAMNALAFTENWNAELTTGTLIVHELTLDARTKVSDEVREFQEVQWPAEGIMYIIPSGDRQGIWVAKAK